MVQRMLRPGTPIELNLTLDPLRHGAGDPSIRIEHGSVWRATRTPDGPGTVCLANRGAEIEVTAWGPGAEWLLATAPELVGLDDDPGVLRPVHPIVRALARRFAGLRIGRTNAVFEALLPAIIEQKVTGDEARRSYRGLLRTHGEAAPGPVPLVVPPSPGRLAALPYYAFHEFGLEQRRADTIRRSAARVDRLQASAARSYEAAYAELTAIPGIGPWTAAEVGRAALGDPDAVSVGDFHLPSLVTWLLAGEPRGDDARMLELLEPYRGQRGRVVRLLEASGMAAPRRGPRMPSRSIAGL